MKALWAKVGSAEAVSEKGSRTGAAGVYWRTPADSDSGGWLRNAGSMMFLLNKSSGRLLSLFQVMHG
jgi:hypothetical protein